MTWTKHRNRLLEGELLDSAFADAYRALRATIGGGSNGHRRVRSLVVASARAAEGRTTTVVNLGIIVGRSGGRALLVDGDLRHPGLFDVVSARPATSGPARRKEVVSPHPEVGLAEIIRGEAGPQQALMATRFEGVWLLTAGNGTDQPADILGSRRVADLLQELAEAFDLVLIDTPPCLDYVDAVLLTGHTDGVLYVVKAGAQDIEVQRRVQSQLQQAHANVVGVVVNKS